MYKINPLNLLAIVLIIVGLIGPWFNFNVPAEYGDSVKKYLMGHFCISPFYISINVTSTSATSVFEDVGVIGSGIFYFDNEKTLFVGILCIFGAFLSFIGECLNRAKITFASGIIVMVSVLSCFLLVPAYVISYNAQFT